MWNIVQYIAKKFDFLAVIILIAMCAWPQPSPFCQYWKHILIRNQDDVNRVIKYRDFCRIDLRRRNPEISDFDIAQVLKSPCITTVYIGIPDLTNIKLVLANSRIQHIWLQCGNVPLDVVSEIVKSNTTRSLAIALHPDTIKLLTQMTSLELILFGRGWVEKSAAMDICKIQNLKFVDFSYADMRNDVARYILENTTAQVINIKLRDTYPREPLIEKIYTWLEKLVNKTQKFLWINYIAVRILSLISPHISISHFRQYKFTRPWPLTINVVSGAVIETFKNKLYDERTTGAMFMLDQIFPHVISDLVFSYGDF